ncbi:MAG: hypothetical protein ACN6PN_22100, partial [Sphingobacterium sp.]
MDRKHFLLSLLPLGLSFHTRADFSEEGLNLILTKPKKKKIGIIGLDSTHAIAFTKAINTASADSLY